MAPDNSLLQAEIDRLNAELADARWQRDVAIHLIVEWSEARVDLCAHYISGSKAPAFDKLKALGEAEDRLRKFAIARTEGAR